MKTLKEILSAATTEHWATGHFNISNLEFFRAVVAAMKNTGAYALVGLSEGERKYVGLKQAVALAKAFEEEYAVPIFLNADHSKSVETACSAANAGFNSIHIDASEYPYEKNVEMTKEVVSYTKKISPDISVEGELGFVPGESKVENTDVSIDEALYTDPEKVSDFVESTGIDRLAIFVGNVHGLHKSEPTLDVERIRKIRKNIPPDVALVLHAGSGIPSDDIKKAMDAGIANIHISTELRVLFSATLRAALQGNPKETTPYKFMKAPMEAVQRAVEEKIIAFDKR